MLSEEEIIDYALSLEGANVRYPYGDSPMVLSTPTVHEFAELYEGTKPLHIVLKCQPDHAIRLREQYPDAVRPGYRCCKCTWNSVFVNGTIPDDEIKEMIRTSYTLAMKLRQKKKKSVPLEDAPLADYDF